MEKVKYLHFTQKADDIVNGLVTFAICKAEPHQNTPEWLIIPDSPSQDLTFSS